MNIDKLHEAEPGQWAIARDRGVVWKNDDPLVIQGFRAFRVEAVTPQKVRADRDVGYRRLIPRDEVVALPDGEDQAKAMLAAIAQIKALAEADEEPHRQALRDIHQQRQAAIASVLGA